MNLKERENTLYRNLANSFCRVFEKYNMYEIFEKSRIAGTIDCAVPWEWQKKLIDLGIDQVDYVWHYAPGDNFGKPLSKLSIVVAALKAEQDRCIKEH